MKNTANSTVGMISLWASILGIVVPVLIAFLVRIFVKENDDPYYTLCVLLFAGAELVALITGILGRHTLPGKAGLVISLVCIILIGGTAFLSLRAPAALPEREMPLVKPGEPQE